MRVANKTMYDAMKHNLGAVTEGLYKANQVVSTGKRITALSDDPVGLTQVLTLKSALSNIEQLRRNIDLGKSWLAASESALSQVQDIVSEAKALCVEMATATTGAAQRSSAAETVSNMRDEIVSLANSDVNGRYIFAGSKTDTTPFDQSGAYEGDHNPFTVAIDGDAKVQIGFDGKTVFQPSGAGSGDDIFQTLEDLTAALEGNDASGIQAAIGKLDAHFDHLSTKISDAGSKVIRMETKEAILQDLKIANTERMSNIEDADIAQAMMDLNEKEVAYKAALASSSKVVELSLVDYL
ncbi:MAG: flagellar hook-associated protein FlgL [Thermodesulfobacteriota bacterium]